MGAICNNVEKIVEEQKDLETARRMKTKGYDVEDIADITGLTAKDIEGLQDISSAATRPTSATGS